MTSNYPLYDYLNSKNVLTEEIDMKLISSTINSIKTLSEPDSKKHYDEINNLIYYHYFRENGKYPVGKGSVYGATIMAGSKGMIYTIKKFPINLQLIIQNYCTTFSE